MSDVLLGIGMVLVIEGLVYALAPSLVERLLETLRAMPVETRRAVGLGAIFFGLIFLWAAQRVG
ncbi:DUF2065 domain-containing protein [Puniceibacterium sediminis]|uniref:DUF2065 domain-containing protein n=1 Tax=Puniceibacterium sediminis TaxID=1608407 RepID=A0A238UWA8_9RHOB|nr:DUF2065 domain-containing protein [Puniceibacterium sediminis]SNR26161.1 hypothetical protein SAMN06265370_101198 [Puniceibacterium sediminis]